MRLILILACLVSLPLGAAGCGSGDDSGGAAVQPGTGGSGVLFDGPAPASPGAVASAPAPAVSEAAPVVLFLGDSIGAGLHLSEREAFPAVLQARLAAEDLGFRLVNASESGRTSAGGSAALDWAMRSEPDVVVIELGGNDGLRGIDLADVERNLRSLIERAREAGARVLLLGMRLPENYGEYAEQFAAVYERLAEEYELEFVPYFMRGVGGVPELNLPDGLHPTAKGHERLADTVEPALQRALKAVAAEQAQR